MRGTKKGAPFLRNTSGLGLVRQSTAATSPLYGGDMGMATLIFAEGPRDLKKGGNIWNNWNTWTWKIEWLMNTGWYAIVNDRHFDKPLFPKSSDGFISEVWQQIEGLRTTIFEVIQMFQRTKTAPPLIWLTLMSFVMVLILVDFSSESPLEPP